MMHLLQQKDNNKVRICDCRIIKAWDVSVIALFQLCFRERFFWLCAILFSTRITEICTERKDAPSNCTGPCPRSPPLVFYPASLSRHWALNCLRPSQQKRDISCFWGVRFFFSLPPGYQEGETQQSKDELQSRDRGTGAHNFTCLFCCPDTGSYYTFQL